MEEWKEYRLGELLNFRRGHDLPKTQMVEGNIPVAGSNGIIGYHNEQTPVSPCITIGRSGNVGTPYIYDKCWAHNTVLYIDDYKGNDPKFLYYFLKTLPLSSFGGGSAVPTLNRNHIHPMIVRFCKSLPTQRKIASILSSLDDKIEVNRRINEQLEELAQALFKSWFVDFEPFKDEEFVDSELGMIPKGWKVGELQDIGEVVGGATPSKANQDYYTEKGISWITPKDLSINKNKFIDKGETDITELGYSKCSAKLMPKGSVLFSSRAPIGYIAIAKNELCTNQGFKSVVPKIAGTAFIYFYLRNNVSNIESMASGSTFKEASGSLMKSLKVIVPPVELLHIFEDKVSALFDKQESLEQEITHLTHLRDTLLPKLMSGEIDVNEVQI